MPQTSVQRSYSLATHLAALKVLVAAPWLALAVILISSYIVAVAVPQAAPSAPSRQSIVLVLGAIALIAAGAVGSGFLLSRKLTRILRALAAAARSLGDGEPFSIAPSSLREANEIGAALQQAAGRLSEHDAQLRRVNEDLEHRVDDRTRELHAAAEAYHAIVDNAKDAIVVSDGEGKITFLNKAAESIFGYSIDEAAGRNIAILLPEAHRSAYDAYVENDRGERRAGSWHIPVSGCHRDGSRIALDLALAEWHDGEGRLHFTAILRDMRKRRAAELRAATEAAEAAQARAEAASRAKSQFLASMSHEIRTPLNAISGFAQLIHGLGGTLTRERLVRYTQNIMDASEQLKTIIDDVLDMARVEAGKVELECRPLDCLEAMTEVYRTVELAAQRRGITFTCDTSGTLPPVYADGARLTQVLLNLASNAMKYNREGGWVLLTAKRRDGKVRFLVRDTGRGIAPEQHAFVFERFDRLGAETGTEEGSGLGLAISRQLVHAMKGEIGFESTPGVGSTFWVDIPVASDDIATTSAAPAVQLDAVDDTGVTILYIEDRKTNIELMRGLVEGLENVRCVDAQTVADGVALATTLRFHIVITDIHLPDGTGFDVLERLRADPRTKHLPVIALTADAMPVNMANMARYGFDHTLTKPFRIDDLMAIISARAKAA